MFRKKKTVVVCSRPRKNVKLGTFRLFACSVMHVQSCCFSNLNLLIFCRSRCRHRRRCLRSQMSGITNNVPLNSMQRK